MSTIEMSFSLSAPARRALSSLGSARVLEYIAERFADTLSRERYRNFAVTPQYYTNPQGYRLAKAGSQRPRGEKLCKNRVQLTIKTLRVMKRLESRGLALTWQLEEMLYFAFCRGLLQ